MKKLLAALSLLSIVLATSTASAGGLGVEEIVNHSGTQFWPSSDGEIVAYAGYLQREWDAYVEPIDGHGRTRLNDNNSDGTLGSLVAGTDTVVFQQFDRRSDLYIHRISTGRTWLMPRPIRSPEWEYWPVASQRFVLFNRAIIRNDRVQRRALVLVDREGGPQRILIRDANGKTVFPGYAGERYVAWSVCGSKTCSVWTFDVDTDTVARVPLPDGKAQYAPAIDETAGTIYLIQTPEDRCGVNVQLRRASLGGSNWETLATLPTGIDTGWTLSFAPNLDTGYQDLFFERWDCDRRKGHVFAFRSVDAPSPPPAVPAGSGPWAAGPWSSRPPLPPGAPSSR